MKDAPAGLACFRLDGRFAAVTGAGRGIGRAAALALAQAGAEVALLSRTRTDLDEVAATIEQSGGKAHVVPLDVTDGKNLRASFAAFETLDILINNAGSNRPESFIDVSEANLDYILSLNVRAAFLAAQAGARKMLETPARRERGGVIVNISSQMGHVGSPGRSVYCMTKHAIEGLTKTMALELAPHNIRVNSLSPTFVETAMTAPFFSRPDFRDWALSRIPAGRFGTLNDIMGAVVFLASPAAALMTGSSLVVDGGWTAQ